MSGLCFLVGGVAFLCGLFALLQHTSVELGYLLIACFMVYISTVVHSVNLMAVSVIAMLSYIAYFTEEHFVHSIGWPAALILLGFIFIGTGAGAVKLKKRYL